MSLLGIGQEEMSAEDRCAVMSYGELLSLVDAGLKVLACRTAKGVRARGLDPVDDAEVNHYVEMLDKHWDFLAGGGGYE